VYSSRVCEHNARPLGEEEKIEISQRIEGRDSRASTSGTRHISQRAYRAENAAVFLDGPHWTVDGE
jgi:hypothetical protein